MKGAIVPARKAVLRIEEMPIIDVSYVELPMKLTHRVSLGRFLGGMSFLAMLAAPGAVEGEMYITAVVLVAIFAVCAHLAIREEGKRK